LLNFGEPPPQRKKRPAKDQKRSAKKNGPVVTRPFGREARIVTPATGDWQPDQPFNAERRSNSQDPLNEVLGQKPQHAE
jgi:hypothetical protein